MRYLVLLMALASTPAGAHENHCAEVETSVSEAGFSDSVSVTCSDTHATITSDTYPDHELMTGITGTNEQVPVPAEYGAPVILSPTLDATPLTRDAALGVAVNGVPIYDYTGGGEMTEADLAHHQTQHDTLQTGQLDVCGGHAGRGDDYHYHVKPTCMIEQMPNREANPIIGWAFDGFPIYGDDNPDGSTIAAGDLSVCNGQPDDIFGYRYHTSEGPPYIIQCLMGDVPDFDGLPRVKPLEAPDGTGAAPGRPPQGGVENLVYTQDPNSGGNMIYTYRGEDFYIRYAPTETSDCYAFETRTVTNNGSLQKGEYCR